MADYLQVADFETKLQAFAARPEGLCTADHCPQTTAEGRQMWFVHITAPSSPPTPRIPVLITGGVHAREWAPPDALVSFIDVLLQTKGTAPSRYPAFTQTTWAANPLPAPAATPVIYPPFSIPADVITSILDRIDLYIAPLVNPDGRFFSRSAGPVDNRLWRKNRASNGAVRTCIDDSDLDQSVGVDINRNFDIAWDIDRLYSGALRRKVKKYTSIDLCPGLTRRKHADSEAYRGSVANGPMSENEVKNMKWLMDKGAQYFVDVHSYGPAIVYPWGIAMHMQNADPTRNFLNTTLDSAAGAARSTKAYAEYIPAVLEAKAATIGGRMQSCVLQTATIDPRLGADEAQRPYFRRLSSQYAVNQSAAGLYPTVGACDDYFFSRQFSAVGPTFPATLTPPECIAYTIECGGRAQGEFWPDRDHEYPKIEREVHAALWGLLSYVAAPYRGATSAWPIQPGP